MSSELILAPPRILLNGLATKTLGADNDSRQDRLARLGQDLVVLLEEAGTRGCPRHAATVIAGVLPYLVEDYPEIADAANGWRFLGEKANIAG